MPVKRYLCMQLYKNKNNWYLKMKKNIKMSQIREKMCTRKIYSTLQNCKHISYISLFLHNSMHTYLNTCILACSYNCKLLWWHAHLAREGFHRIFPDWGGGVPPIRENNYSPPKKPTRSECSETCKKVKT